MKKPENIDDSEIRYGLYARCIKRVIDFAVSFLVLLVLSPVFLIVCILVRIKLGSPIFFKQVRIGRDEKPFVMIKFRTMTDARDESGTLLPDTERFTKFGDFLRNSSLDELPELLNVLKGDMSIVGPRPLYTFYLPYYSEEEALRHAVRGGITGLAQINGRALCRWNERFAYDVKYVRNITFKNDLAIIWKTVTKVLKKSDIGVPSVTDEGGLHIVRELQRPEKVKEIGSSFSAKSGFDGTANYPSCITGKEESAATVFLSTGRSCIREILKAVDEKGKRALIPPFTCESVLMPFVDYGYELEPYSLNADFSVDLEKLKVQIDSFKPEVVLFHRLFGFDTCAEIESILGGRKVITIEDETQFMFSEHGHSNSDYSFGSIRKWGPFPDGAFLTGKKKVIDQPENEDRDFVDIEIKAMKSKQAYLDGESKDTDYRSFFAEGREYIDRQTETFSISSASKSALACVDFSKMTEIRRSNARTLIEGLQGYSWFDCVFNDITDNITPFMIPLLVHEKRKEFQDFLASQKIYATIIWACPDVIEDKIGKTEKRLYDEILCIPCDQRYDSADMMRICSAVKFFSEKAGLH